MGSAFQRESIFAGSNTAVQCMQECSTFTINFKTFARALGTHTIRCNQSGYHGATVQVTSDCSKRKNVLEKTSVFSLDRAPQQLVFTGGRCNGSRPNLCPNLCDCRILLICVQQLRITGERDQIEDQQHSLSVY